ncbi:MAG: type II toxin-antitoxin system Phd/YefM family antitoxin [Planctomycetales bacterium]|nr:type II toxin-antitoxin system Phd/YefM family antitoxin [Planctomycetales bacterium]
MLEVNATEFKTQFGRFLDLARDEFVHIRRSGKPAAVMLSDEDFEYYQALEDAFLGVQAELALKRGDFVDEVEAMRIINERLNAGK